MTTIYDVASEAGVSISTVSLVLNSPGRVSTETRRKVLTAADTLGFVPKTDAVARARRGVGRIGVIAPHTSYPSVARRLNGVLTTVGRRPLDVVLFDQESAAESPAPLLGSLPLTGRLDGLIVMSLPLDTEVADRLAELRIPTILVDVRHRGFDSVHTDDSAGGRLVAAHLSARGHHRFGFLGEAQKSPLYVSPSQRRLDGYRAALADVGHPLADRDVKLTGRGLEPAFAVAKELLTGADRPTAIFAGDDTLAAGTLRAAHDLGLAVPADVAVVGFDDGELAGALDLTTVRQPLEETGHAAMERLLRRLDEPGPAHEVTLQLKLISRGTS